MAQRIDGLNPVDFAVGDILRMAQNHTTDERIGEDARMLIKTIDRLFTEAGLDLNAPMSESCNAHPELGRAEARFKRARMDAAITSKTHSPQPE